jgi:2-polyprenyl-3-methyl-5-hydroxy-6-metoxy-1,4-benzoquinol methylase
MITGRPQGPRYDVVLFMSVIEHLSSSPKNILRILYDCLVPGGLLILDTPNLAYLPNRRKLNRGESPYVPIAEQFKTEIPFEGHVREYTAKELHWMLTETGFMIQETRFFNYSPPSLSEIPMLDHLRLLFPPYCQSPIMDRIRMALHPDLCEMILVAASKPR